MVFGTIGWLFADLMFALAMAFLVATTVGLPELPHPEPSPPPTPTSSPAPSSTATPEQVLELSPDSFEVTVDWQRLLAGDPAARRALQNQVKARKELNGRRAGLVLTYGGATGNADSGRAVRIAKKVNESLAELGTHGYVFRHTAYRPFLTLGTQPSKVTIDVYLFKLKPVSA